MAYFNWDTPDPNKILDYVESRGGQGRKSMAILSRGLHFVDVFNTPIGFELLCDLVKMHSERLEKICDLQATELEKVEYKVCSDLIDRWALRIKAYESEVQKVIKKTNG